MIRHGELELVTSYVLWFENSQNPYMGRKMSISDFIKENSTLHIGKEKESDIKSRADKIISTGIKVKDAYHIACAIYAECEYFFTTDYRLLKYDTSEIKICNPIEFFNSTEEK